jgi:hypothetical protein
MVQLARLSALDTADLWKMQLAIRQPGRDFRSEFGQLCCEVLWMSSGADSTQFEAH